MRTCWLCGKNGADEPLDRHHLFGGGNRRKSEQLGLVVDLCHGSCHIFGERAAHRCREMAQALHEYGQRLAMERMGWSTEEFVREFGRNYLDEGADVATEQNVQPFPSSGASRHLPPEGKARGAATASPQGEADGRTEASAPTGAETGFEVTDFELCVNW